MTSQFSLFFLSLVLFQVVFSLEENFADNLAGCTASNTINFCLTQTLEELRPLMRTGISKLGLPPTEPMEIDSMQFSQGSPPVIVQATFSNVVVKGLSNFITDFIEVDPSTRNLRIGLTVPEMDITGLYRINGEVFILPLEGGGTFANKMNTVQVVGYSTIVPVTNSDGKQVLKVENFIVDFTIGNVFIHMDNLFNGENQLLADTVNKFLNEHSQEVIKEVKPEISKQLSELVTRVMNDAFSELPADKLIESLNKSFTAEHVPSAPQPPLPLPPHQPLQLPPQPHLPSHQPLQLPHPGLQLQKTLLGSQQRLGQQAKARLLQLFTGRK